MRRRALSVPALVVVTLGLVGCFSSGPDRSDRDSWPVSLPHDRWTVGTARPEASLSASGVGLPFAFGLGWRYDPRVDRWDEMPKPAFRTLATSHLVVGRSKVFLIGTECDLDSTTHSTAGPVCRPGTAAEVGAIYDPSEDRWTRWHPPPGDTPAVRRFVAGVGDDRPAVALSVPAPTVRHPPYADDLVQRIWRWNGRRWADLPARDAVALEHLCINSAGLWAIPHDQFAAPFLDPALRAGEGPSSITVAHLPAGETAWRQEVVDLGFAADPDSVDSMRLHCGDEAVAVTLHHARPLGTSPLAGPGAIAVRSPGGSWRVVETARMPDLVSPAGTGFIVRIPTPSVQYAAVTRDATVVELPAPPAQLANGVVLHGVRDHVIAVATGAAPAVLPLPAVLLG